MDVLASSYVGVDGYNSNYYLNSDTDYSIQPQQIPMVFLPPTMMGWINYSETVNNAGDLIYSNYYEEGWLLTTVLEARILKHI